MDRRQLAAVWLRRISLFATVLAFIVVVLGAYTRLKDAGLGCPDWPGCYGHMLVQDSAAAVSKAEHHYPGASFNSMKAWTEMVHRYAAGTLGVCILLIFLIALKRRTMLMIPAALVSLVIMQAALGMWTVTLKLLPTIVTLHLIGGMSILSLLWLYHLRLKQPLNFTNQTKISKLKPWAIVGVFVIAGQILLGGWTSTNYAALSCPDFPYCQGQLLPDMSYEKAFNIISPIGVNYEGGVLDNQARKTIHMAHRLGAILTTVYLTILALLALRDQRAGVRKTAKAVLVFLVGQVSLGIANVVYLLPLPVAVGHNGIAALLLLSVLALAFFISREQAHE